MQHGHPFVLTIGGFDPSNGAGITADVKTFSAHGVPALAVQTCLTVQHESEVTAVHWHSEAIILAQLAQLAKRYSVSWIKLSLTEDLAAAGAILNACEAHWPEAKVLWDPIAASSSGFGFSRDWTKKGLIGVLERVEVATPNRVEIKRWSTGNPETIARSFAAYTNILLKGGHDEQFPGRDMLFETDGGLSEFAPEEVAHYEKHGSGCVFGSALVSGLAGGLSLRTAIKAAKSYMNAFLNSDPSLLGRHSLTPIPEWQHGE